MVITEKGQHKKNPDRSGFLVMAKIITKAIL